MKDYEHPFYQPLWRRIAVVAICLGWSAVEFWNGAPFWGTMALGSAGYAVWQFFYLFKPVDPQKPAGPEAEE